MTSPTPARAPWFARLRAIQWAALVVVALLALLTAGTVGYAVAGPRPPGDSSAEAGFSRDMQAHHAQAVQMSMLVRDRTTDPTIRSLASDIALGQEQQIGQMFGWLSQWGLRQGSTGPQMAWMSEDHSMGGGSDMPAMHLLPDGRMPGMATQSDINRLTSLKGRPAEVLYLQLMVAHHRGGISMAQTVLEMTDVPVVRSLAQNVITNQQAEVQQMTELLTERGAAP